MTPVTKPMATTIGNAGPYNASGVAMLIMENAIESAIVLPKPSLLVMDEVKTVPNRKPTAPIVPSRPMSAGVNPSEFNRKITKTAPRIDETQHSMLET